MTEAFNRLTIAAASGRLQTLAQMGIIVDLKAEYKKYGTELTEVQKQQIRLNAILDAAKAKISVYGAAVDTNRDIMDRYSSQLADLSLEFGLLLTSMTPVLTAITKAIGGMRVFFGIGQEEKLQKRIKDILKDLEKLESGKVKQFGGHTITILTNQLEKAREGLIKLQKPIIIQPAVFAKGGGVPGGGLPSGETGDAALEKRFAEIRKKLQIEKRFQNEFNLVIREGTDRALEALKQKHESDVELAKKHNVDMTLLNKRYLIDQQNIINDAKEKELAILDKFDAERLTKLKNENDKYLAELESADMARSDTANDLTSKIKRLTLSETNFKIWALNQETEALRKKFQSDKEILDQITQFHNAALNKIKENTEKTFGGDMKNAVSGWANNFSSTLTDMVFGAELSFKSIARSFAKMITQMIIQKAVVGPLLGIFGLTPAASGGTFSGLGVIKNQVINKPTVIPFAAGGVLIGEGGSSEAVMPLTRTRSGDLGVKTTGGGGGNNIQYVDMRESTFLDQETMAQTMGTIAEVKIQKFATQVIVNDFNFDGDIRSIMGRA